MYLPGLLSRNFGRCVLESLEIEPFAVVPLPLDKHSQFCLARCLAQIVQEHPELVGLNEAWPALPEQDKTKVKALFQTHEHEAENR